MPRAKICFGTLSVSLLNFLFIPIIHSSLFTFVLVPICSNFFHFGRLFVLFYSSARFFFICWVLLAVLLIKLVPELLFHVQPLFGGHSVDYHVVPECITYGSLYHTFIISIASILKQKVYLQSSSCQTDVHGPDPLCQVTYLGAAWQWQRLIKNSITFETPSPEYTQIVFNKISPCISMKSRPFSHIQTTEFGWSTVKSGTCVA